MSTHFDCFLVHNIGTAVTLAPLVAHQKFTDIVDSDLGSINDAWIAVRAGKILEVGQGSFSQNFGDWPCVDAKGGLLTPGLIDAHTHILFAGSRAREFAMRLSGKTYQEIAEAGGGIKATVHATRAAPDEELERLAHERLQTFISHGVTTIEAKSGYGLSVAEELRHLRILRRVQSSTSVHMHVTCLALHAVPPEAKSAAAWSRQCATDLLPVVARDKLADSVDVFIEQGYFSVEDAKPYLDAAQGLGLSIRVHADEFSDVGAAACAGEYRALSADHLQFASAVGIKRMAERGVVALILPGTSIYTAIPFTDARPFKQRGCPVGLATDFNPGSCQIDNLRLIMTLGALHCKLTPAEAVAAVTWVAAKSLGLTNRKGALAPGMDADFAIFPLSSVDEFVADLGRCKPLGVFSEGVSLL